MRTFIGIDFPKSLKEQIIQAQSYLKSISKKGRWKYIDNFHLTLKFLGEVEYDHVEKIREVLAKNLEGFSSFSLRIFSCGYFKGSKDVLRVVYLKPEGDLDKLNTLYQIVEDSLYSIGFDKEKREYTPHITIAQDVILDESFEKFKQYVENYKFDPIPVESVILFLSEEIDRKRVYTPLFEIKLK
ncbi:RNA 2',3'-cyclic phosphodiesterase [Caldicellulosiruptor morganii]|uniref:RNA 2',3'-cyclic phosphodiesterase n=1 Tax=Caldicellulosiruptor morganii TaxID=1387555 RepID=A0ABY7BJL6_9FIRM|nr:RNA 2',3'-cyclic phosphodiesterase [Caldicellulosiruptor morganii]WAM33033.1 RNA 2',3'-cyclic phosphodiesterase [Caldicellulosiruptor morganii]